MKSITLAAFFHLQHRIIYTWIDSTQPLLVPWLVKSLKKLEKLLLSLNIAMIKSGVKTYVYCIHTARFDSFLTSLTHNWPLMTFWPDLTFRVNHRSFFIAINYIYFTTCHIIIFHDSIMEPIFFRFTNRDRAKNYRPIPNLCF